MRVGLCVVTAVALVVGMAPSMVEAQEPSAEIDAGAAADEIVTSDGVPPAPRGSSAEVAAPGRAFDPGSLSDQIVNEPAPPVPPDARDPLDADEDSGQESLIGPDGRTQVTDTTSYPSSAIGQLVFDQGSSTYICTGYLIDQNTVFTSGHCVHDSTAGWSTNVVFTPGRNGSVAPFGSCPSSNLGSTNGWVNNQDEYHDFGYVQLGCTIGRTVGWLGYYAFSDAELTSRPSTVRGYPGDKPAGTMWTDPDYITAIETDMLYYQSDTFGGMSGSPVYDTDSGCGGPCAMAIHSYGTQALLPPPHSTNNHGPRLTGSRVSSLADAAAANDPADTEPPTIQIISPRDGETVLQGQTLRSGYGCTEEPWESGVATCTAPVPDGDPIDTSTLGSHEFAVTGTDNAGNTTTVTHTYTIVPGPALTVTKTADQTSVAAGADIDYHVAIENTGNVDLSSVVVTDAKAPDCDGLVPDIAVGDTTTVDCSYTTKDPGDVGTYSNTASVVTTEVPGPTMSNQVNVTVNPTTPTCTDHGLSDVPAWIQTATTWAVCNNYMEGYPDNTFRPNNPITRGQAARVAFRIAGSPTGSPANTFPDVPNWLDPAVDWMSANSYMTGYPDGNFKPNGPITRGEEARMLFRVAGSPGGSPANTFPDVPPWLDPAVNWHQAKNYMDGYPDGTFRDTLNISRGQVVNVEYNINK